jgi:hypothetical protein
MCFALYFVFCVFVLFCVLLLLTYIFAFFLFVYKCTDHCHRVETQLPLINVTSYQVYESVTLDSKVHLRSRVRVRVFETFNCMCLIELFNEVSNFPQFRSVWHLSLSVDLFQLRNLSAKGFRYGLAM